MGPCIVEIDFIVIREVQYQFEVNQCRNKEIIIISSHLRLWSHLGHRPPTSFLQASRFWASLSSCPHVWPICLASASRSRCQVFLGRPLFLFHWGFHVRDCLVVLDAGLRRVWPIHLQRL
ncbi:hypothetical protein DPMN_096839 [Dreissena polymorpha]|uniref:Uncharacterized protein n=1 Tax=Dreissena polymorpha TaxID=45954 RepID=A0A9D4L957_DREPO|nr:hypothetical protein DPMN_096839 [Dreissena polymorpha]